MKPSAALPKVYLLLETGGGGAGRHVLDLYNGLTANGWNVHLLLSTSRMDAAFTKEIAALPQETITRFELHRSPHLSDIQVIRRLRRIVRQEKCAVILHAHSTKAGLVAWAVRGRTACRIFTPHAYPCMDPGRSRRQVPLLRCVEKLFSKPFEGIIAVSEDEQKYTATLGICPDRIHQISNGVDADSVRRQAVAGYVPRRGKGPVLGFLGRLVEQKNPTLFVETLADMVQRGHDATALVVGDGPLRATMQQAAESLGVNGRIRWMGAVPGLPQLQNMDVMLHTSISESLPYSLLEAVAAGVPVVATSNPGSRGVFAELLPELLVPCGTPQGLVDTIVAVLHDDALRENIRERYPLISERYSTRDMVRKTAEVYQSALKAREERAAAAWRVPRLLPKLQMPRLGSLLRRTLTGSAQEPDDLLTAGRGGR